MRTPKGNFLSVISPLWLAPDQVRVIILNDDTALIDYAQPIVNELRANMVRVDSDFSATPFKAKFADEELEWCRSRVGGSLLTSRLARTLAPPARATWEPAQSACVSITAARRARSRMGKSSRILWQASKNVGLDW